MVVDTSDGIAHISGLPSAMANELLEFPRWRTGRGLNLEATEIGAVVLGDFQDIAEGQEVKRTGDVLSVPVGDGYLGRVVNPLGQPIDGLGEIESTENRASSCRPRPCWSASRSRSRCRPASRPSTR